MIRLLSAFAGSLMMLALAHVPAVARQDKKDDDHVIDGKKASDWIDIIVKDESARKRALAVEALSKFWIEKHNDQAIFYIGRALRSDTSVAVRTQAAIALGGLRPVEVKLLIEMKQNLGIKDLVDSMGTEKESRVKKEIAKAIGRFPVVAKMAVTQLTGALKDADAGTRAIIAETIAVAGSDAKSAAAGLVPLLTDEDKTAKRAAIAALGRISPEGSATIAETMAKMLSTEKETDIRIELATSIGLLGEKSPTVVAALTALLTETDDALRRRATRTLGTFGTAAASAADALFKVAGTDKQKDIRVDAVRGFGSAIGPEGVKARVKDFLSLLVDPEYEVRLAIVDEIGSLGNDLMEDQATIKALRVRLSDPHPKVREAVTTALVKIEKKADPKKDPEPKKE